MFVTETTALLPHPLLAVTAVVRSVRELPRWCAGLRRPLTIPGTAPVDRDRNREGASGCALRYGVTRELSLTLVGHSTTHPLPHQEAGVVVVHVAKGEGVTLTWTFALREESGPHTSRDRSTRLVARVAFAVDPEHAVSAHRAAISRLIARRAPEDLARLAALLERKSVQRRAPEHPTPEGATRERSARPIAAPGVSPHTPEPTPDGADASVAVPTN
jgi:hypothetical protein